MRVVDPRLRGGWANIAMLWRAARNGLESGGQRFRFYCDDTVADTISLARRAGASHVRTTVEFSAPLGALTPAVRVRSPV